MVEVTVRDTHDAQARGIVAQWLADRTRRDHLEPITPAVGVAVVVVASEHCAYAGFLQQRDVECPGDEAVPGAVERERPYREPGEVFLAELLEGSREVPVSYVDIGGAENAA
ncbi:MAG: hypothetical protein QF570_01545 [Myxococcota bacterium]|nr:hypothetical protein [Myxococcota bacterium]